MNTLHRPGISVSLPLLLAMVLSCSPRLEERVKAFERAYNERDVEKVMSFYAEDAVHAVPGVFVAQGSEELRALTEHDAVLNTRLSLGECRTVGDTVRCELTFSSDWTTAAGIRQVRYSAAFVFSDGLIKEFVTEVSPEGAQAFSNVFNPFLAWASAEKPEQVREMMPEGEFVYSAQNAKRSLALLREWQQEMEESD